MSRLEEAIQKAISDKVFPGGSLLVARGEDILYRHFFGSETLLPNPEPVTEKTLFDIASLTKPIATASLFLHLCHQKGLSLTSQAALYLLEFSGPGKKNITLRHLLSHMSGLADWKPYFKEIHLEDDLEKRRAFYLKKISEDPLQAIAGSKKIYSDLGFILLGFVLEKFLKQSLDKSFQKYIADPLGLTQTFFIPEKEEKKKKSFHFAATEVNSWRGRLLRGEVHDDNAAALGGVAGHAGLFSHVDDLHHFLLAFRKGFQDPHHPVFPQAYVHKFVGPQVRSKLGWDTPSQKGSQAGKYFSKKSIGHLGYSGCSLWMDLEQDFHVIFLTNRVHPSSENESIKEFRPKIHDLIYEEFLR